MGKPRKSPVSDAQIIEKYRETHSAKQTAIALGIGGTTVERVLHTHREPRPGVQAWRDNRTLYRGVEQTMRADYEAGFTYEQLIEKYGPGSTWSIKEALHRAGTELREDRAQLLKDGELERIKELNAAGVSQMDISITLDRSQSFIGRVMAKNGIPPLGPRGDDHSNWKGGRWVDSHGYVRLWVADDDPMASMRHSDNYVLEHRLVMARKLGRPLRRSETVHHIDGCHDNNAPANLQLRQGRHGKNTVWVCLACGSHNVEAMPLADDPTASDASSKEAA